DARPMLRIETAPEARSTETSQCSQGVTLSWLGSELDKSGFDLFWLHCDVTRLDLDPCGRSDSAISLLRRSDIAGDQLPFLPSDVDFEPAPRPQAFDAADRPSLGQSRQ